MNTLLEHVQAVLSTTPIGFEIDPKQAEIARERLATMQLPLFDVSVSQLSLEEGGVVAIVSEEAS